MGVKRALRIGLLERDDELARLGVALNEVEHGRGGLVLIRGEAGIGKTELLREARAEALGRGLTVLAARGAEIELGLGFGLARQMLEPSMLTARGSRRAALVEAAGPAAALLTGGRLPDEAGSDPVGGLVLSLYWVLATLAEGSPVVVIVDDAHWADGPSLRLLAHTARRLDDVPLLLVVATRPFGESVDPSLAELVQLAAGETVEPQALSSHAAAGVIGARLGAEPDPAFVAACHEATGGNPFLVEQLSVALEGEGVAPVSASAERVRSMGSTAIAQSVLLRIARLGATAARVARATAVLGPDAPARHVAAVAELDLEATLRCAAELSRVGVLADASPLRFAHPVLQVSIGEDLGAAERARLHARAAAALGADGLEPERVAAHLLLAEPGLVADARSTLVQAGEAALARGVPAAAARFLARARAEPGGEEPGLVRLQGVAALRAGDPGGIELLEAVLGSDDQDERAQAASALGVAFTARGDIPSAIRILERATDETTDRELALHLEAELVALAFLHPDGAQLADERLSRHLAIVGETPAERLILANVARHLATSGAGGVPAADAASKALRGGVLVREATADAPSIYHAIFALIAGDRFDDADHVLGVALEDARARGSLFGFAMASTFRSMNAFRRGVLGRAEAESRAALEATREAGWPLAMPNALGHLIDALLERGDVAGARRELEAFGLEVTIPDGWLFQSIVGSRARLRLAEGDHAGVLADIADADRREHQFGVRGTGGTTHRWWVAPALLALGRPEDAVRRADEELEISMAWGTPRPMGMALRAKGLVTGGEDGIAFLARAVDVLAPSGAELEHARALIDLGAAIRRAKRRAEAREPLRAGLDLADRLGAVVLAERAREELGLAGARPRRAALSGSSSLTPSERRIAEMAAAGKTNRQIAQELFLTMKTVAYHLTNAYRKLDVSARDALSAALAD